MRSPRSYYEDDFGAHLLTVQAASTATIKDRISIVSLLPTDQYPGRFGESAAVFRMLPSQRLFLFCYFFTALVDQTIHSSLPEEHAFFGKLARYPKFVGVLGTYHHNLHPGLLLLAATLFTPAEERDSATREFRELADFFARDYEDFLLSKYPSLTGRLCSDEERRSAVRRLYIELSNATALLFIPRSLAPYATMTADASLYESWMAYFSGRINERLRTDKE